MERGVAKRAKVPFGLSILLVGQVPGQRAAQRS
jgi:hypothetical protein